VIEPPTAELKPDRSLAASIAIAGCAIVAFAALLVLAWYSAPTILLLFSGVLFGVFLVALSDLVGRLIGGPHALRLVIVCVFLTGLFGGVMVLGGATIAQQAVALSDTIRSQVRTVRTFLEERGIETNFLDLDQTPSTSEQPQTPPSRPNLPSASTIASGTGAILSQTWKILSGLFETIGNIFIIVLLGLLLATQPGLYRRGVLRLLPRRYASDAAQLADDIGETLRRWLIGQLMTMSFIFVITWIGLAVIGVPGALVLGFIAGFLAFIPNIGAVLAGVLIVLASLGSGLAAVAGAFGLYVLVQFLEGNIFTPLIQRHAIDVPPATLFAAQIFLGFLFGLWGLALALPLIAVANVVLKHLHPVEQTAAASV
jgi:predicted PurR-regulated permease PerM